MIEFFNNKNSWILYKIRHKLKIKFEYFNKWKNY